MLTTNHYPLKILLLIFLVLSVIAGGDSYASERKRFKLIVTRPGSNVTTILRVYAENKEEAIENTALNNWQIIDVQEYGAEISTSSQMRGRGADSSAASDTYNIIITKVGEGSVEPEGTVNIAKGDSLMLKLTPGPCEKIGKLIYNGIEQKFTGDSFQINEISKDGSIVAVFSENGNQCSDNGILSANLNELGVIYFALGKYKTELSSEFKNILADLKSEKDYVIIGHTDDVKVIPNKNFEDNFQLSVKRAEFLLSHLITSEIKGENVKIIGLGPAFPAAPNKNKGQPLNRRAVLYERIR